MKIIFVDPFLKDEIGHTFNYAFSLKNECNKRGFRFLVLGSLSANKCLETFDDFYPCLPAITTLFFSSSNFLSKIFNFFRKIFLFKKYLENILFKNKEFKIETNDIIFIHTIYVFELLSFGIVINKYKKLLRNRNVKIILGLNFACAREEPITSFISKTLYKIAISYVLNNTGIKIIYFSDGESLKKEYERLIKTHVYVFPVPIFIPSFFKDKKVDINKEKIVVSYIGSLRYNKGFDIFVKILYAILCERDMVDKISFVVQLASSLHVRSEIKKIGHYVSFLGELSDKYENIKIVYGGISSEEYYDLLRATDIVMLPYRSIFRNVPSNIFLETLLMDKIPFVTLETSMAFLLKKYGLSDLCFPIIDIKKAVTVIKKILNNYNDYYKEYLLKTETLRRNLKKFNTPQNMVDVILSFIGN
ncbi:MAG: hypothetical protein N2643_00635 [Endomicrobia bacterium]|nr:hypothetical protein [Endomicrobiia bacterium]